MGPIQLIPHQGSGWAPIGAPERLRATYQPPHGVRYLFGAYDVHADRLHGRLRAHKNAGEVLGFCSRSGCATAARQRIYLSPTTSPRTGPRRSASGPPAQRSSSSPRPTYASFLNRIECHFWGIGEFVINNADYPDWDTLPKAMADHIRLRNRTHGGGPIATIEARRRVA